MAGKHIRKIMIFIILIMCLYSIFASNSYAEEKIFIKEYTYNASDLDSKVSSRAIALEQVKRLVLEELGTYLKSRTTIKNFELTQDQVTAFAAGITRIMIVDERWNGKTYYLKAKIVADPEEVARSIEKVRADQTMSRESEETSRKADEALKEIDKLRKELETMKTDDKRKQKYAKAVDQLSSKEWFDKGYALIIADNYQEAVTAYMRVIELEPDNVTALVHLAWAYNGTGHFKKAIDQLDRAIALEPKNEHAYVQRGWSYNGLGEYQQAVIDINKALRLNPNNQWAFFHRGWAYNGLGNFLQAKKDIDNAVKLNPKDPWNYIMRSWSYNGLGSFQEAMKDANTALKLDPNNKYAYIQRGWSYNGLGNYQQAEKEITATLDIDPKFADGYYNLKG
ncbi:MAG: tetratricopeptide repeat protein [Desulfobacterales bacterium]|nr:tetratricopeptide repeat protein [Desulfobacterales bacterium]